MMTKERNYYDREFKKKAVELSFARGNAREIAEELGINPDLLYRWRREETYRPPYSVVFHSGPLGILEEESILFLPLYFAGSFIQFGVELENLKKH